MAVQLLLERVPREDASADEVLRWCSSTGATLFHHVDRLLVRFRAVAEQKLGDSLYPRQKGRFPTADHVWDAHKQTVDFFDQVIQRIRRVQNAIDNYTPHSPDYNYDENETTREVYADHPCRESASPQRSEGASACGWEDDSDAFEEHMASSGMSPGGCFEYVRTRQAEGVARQQNMHARRPNRTATTGGGSNNGRNIDVITLDDDLPLVSPPVLAVDVYDAAIETVELSAEYQPHSPTTLEERANDVRDMLLATLNSSIPVLPMTNCSAPRKQKSPPSVATEACASSDAQPASHNDGTEQGTHQDAPEKQKKDSKKKEKKHQKKAKKEKKDKKEKKENKHKKSKTGPRGRSGSRSRSRSRSRSPLASRRRSRSPRRRQSWDNKDRRHSTGYRRFR